MPEQVWFDEYQIKKMRIRLGVCLAAISAFYVGCCIPLLSWMQTDVLFDGTVWPLLLDLVMLLCNYAFYWITIAILIYSVYRFGWKPCRSLLFIYLGVVLLRHVASPFVSYLSMGESIPRFDEFVSADLIVILVNVILELLMVLGVTLLICQLGNRWGRPTPSAMLSHLPIQKLFDKQNPIARVALFCSIFPAGFHMITRLIYDFSALGGLPTYSFGWLDIVLGYLSDLLFVLVGYFVATLLLNSFLLSEEKARMEFDSASLNL